MRAGPTRHRGLAGSQRRVVSFLKRHYAKLPGKPIRTRANKNRLMPVAPLDYPAHSARRREFADALTSRLLANAICYACLGGLFLVAVVLIARRTQGMLAEPLAATPLLVAGLLIAALTMLAQWQH